MENPTVLITGAGIGIGASTVRAFAKQGFRAIVTDVLEDERREVATSIEASGCEAEYRHLDVTDTDEVDSVVAAVQDQHG